MPLRVRYVYEQNGGADIVGVITDTAQLGSFVLWLQFDGAVQVAGQLVSIVEDRKRLRDEYTKRNGGNNE